MLPKAFTITWFLSASWPHQWRQVSIGRTFERFSLLRIMSLNHRIICFRTGPVKAIDEPAPIWTDLAELIKPAKRNAGSRHPAWDPYFAVVEQSQGNARYVGAGELRAVPFPAPKLRFGYRKKFADVVAVNFQQRSAKTFEFRHS